MKAILGVGSRLLVLLVSVTAPVVAQQASESTLLPEPGSLSDPEAYPRPTAGAVRVSESPIIDGRLDDEVWSVAEIISDFIQSQPEPGRLATERTEVRLLYDDSNLYVGAMLYDSDPDGYVIQSLERDFPSISTRNADIFAITLDTFLDRRNSFIIMINPYGAYRDGQTFNDSRNQDFGFDIPVEIRTAFLDDGWSIELRIPWSGIRYDGARDEQRLGMNLLRRVRRINEDSYWAPVERRDPVHRMSKAGTLAGVTDIPTSHSVLIKPYALAAEQSGSALPEVISGADADVGFDLKYGLTPGLTLDGTFNTDFSQVEVDQERVNLTRFPLFFSEQRDFFVEISGSFQFGDVTERNYRMGASLRDFTLFHSRAIGLDGGRPTPILGGGRLSGSVGPWEVGLLDMRTESVFERPGENFAVARVRREVAGASDVGVMFIDRSSVGGSDASSNRAYGVDANLRLFGGLRINSYLARTETPGATGDQSAARFGAAYRDRDWNVSALYRRIGDDFEPAVGFVRRKNIEHTYVTVGTHRRPPIPFVQEIAPFVEVDHFSNLADTLVTRAIRGGIGIDFTSGATLSASATRRFELVQQSFSAGAGTIPAGEYDFEEASVSYQSSAGWPFSANVSLSGGTFYSGDRRSVGGSFRWLVNHRMAISGSTSYNRIDLPEGAFNSSVYSGRVKYGFSTRLFVSANVQYNEVTDSTRHLCANQRDPRAALGLLPRLQRAPAAGRRFRSSGARLHRQSDEAARLLRRVASLPSGCPLRPHP